MATKSASIRTGGVKRESYFTRFRQRWKRRGVVEIEDTHNKYPFTMHVRQGLQDSVPIPCEIKEHFDEHEYTARVRKQLISSYNNQKFEFVTYAPTVFESLRRRLGMTPDLYSECICPQEDDARYLEFVSNSKSGQNFFLSNDKQLMIKTHTSNEKGFFLKILPRYIEHFQRFPHSLLVKFLGLYKITVAKQQSVYFVVMQSILYPDERISHRYDLKACQAGRLTKIPEENGNVITVMKDVNFGDKNIVLGSQKSWFLIQIQHDTEFLRQIQVIDYSLLVGMQELHAEEVKENKELASIFIRTKKSTSIKHSVLKNWGQSPSKKLAKQTSKDSTSSQNFSLQSGDDIQLPGTVHEEAGSPEGGTSKKSNPTSPSILGNISSFDRHRDSLRSLTESEMIAQNRRLLPQCRNELHVIDGSELERYFVGIIDFFTQYGVRKRLEGAYKAIKYSQSGLSYSTVSPDVYAERFLNFVQDHVA